MGRVFIVLAFGIIAMIGGQCSRIDRLSADLSQERNNVSVLLQDCNKYRTRDSLSAASVAELRLRLDDYERYRAADAALIKTLQTRNRELQGVMSAQLQTIATIRGSVRDSVVYISDTVKAVVRCVDVVQPWYELHGCATESGDFVGTFVSRDSLLIVETVKYKRFLGFLWKTGIKDRRVDVVARNPSTQIESVEFVTISK